jgi:hypothetical protein
MRVLEITRRGLLRGIGAGAAAMALPKVAAAQNEPDEEDVYWGARKDYNEQPRKLIANTTIDKPDQFIGQYNVIVYQKGIFNAMNYKDFVSAKSNTNLDYEALPAGTIPGISEKILLTQMGDYNYFITQSSFQKFAQQYNVEQMVKQNRDVKQKMARGDWSAGQGIQKTPPQGYTDPKQVTKPVMPWAINRQQSI